MKDNFSIQSEDYARYRPGYPQTLLDFILDRVKERHCAWDCGTGNGQFAAMLAPHFDRVIATDISEAQLSRAPQLPNVQYLKAAAEEHLFDDARFDLVTVAQAIHWFDFDAFYTQVHRLLKPGGIIAVIGYDLVQIDPATDAVVSRLYHTVLKGFWDPERSYIDAHYTTVPFPFAELEAPAFEITCLWTRDEFMGYLHTWSAVQHFRKKQGSDPVALVESDLQLSWGNADRKKVRFPILLRLGKG